MKIVKYTILVILVCLGLAAGFAKIMLVPEEVDFFSGMGLSESLLQVFGVIQFLASIMLALPKTRLWGAGVLGLTFTISSILISIKGEIGFVAVSLVPIIALFILIILDREHQSK